jgi:acyl-[acyl carrier protein]--UDP-N-acetylglucosamine O-acyltransferase
MRCINTPSKKAVLGVTSLGLATTVLPAANAGAIFQVNKYKGKFQGEMQPTTPSG